MSLTTDPHAGPAEGWTAADFAAATGATPAQMADMERYLALLSDWNEKINLVGPSALAAFWLRHAYDSAQLLDAAPDALIWADIGAGAGFPGLVLAILLKGREGAHVHLVESIAKRCRFLQAVADALALPVTVHNARAESLRLTGIDVVTARACAPMGKLLGYARSILRSGARGLFLKGRDADADLADAAKTWRFEAAMIPSKSDPSGRIIVVTKLSPRSPHV